MAGIRGELVVIAGRYRGHRVPLRGDIFRIGRDRSCEVALDDEAASRVHLELVRKGSQFVARDLKSTNGTYVNESRITEVPLQNGDRISVGDTQFLLHLEQEEEKLTPQVVFAKEQKPTSARMSISLSDTKFLELKAGTSIDDAQKQFTQLYEFMVDIAGILHLPALLERALNHFFKSFPADRGMILLLTADGEPGLKVARLRDGVVDNDSITISRTMAHQVLQKKESFVSMDATSDKRFSGSESLATMKVKSVMCAPLKVKDKITGMLYLDTTGTANPFTEENLKLFSAMAVQLAVCVENGRLYTELLDAAEFNNSILRSMQSGIVVLDITGRILRVNKATADILQKPEGQMLGRQLLDFPELSELHRVMQQTLLTGAPEDRYEVPVKVNEDLVPLGLSTSALTDHAGKVVGAVAHFRNLTAIRRLEEQVRRSQHLAALGQMAAGVAHEVRNPLNTIRGFAQLLQEKTLPDAQRGEYTQIILEEVDRMNRIVQDLLDFSRQRELTLIPVPIDALLKDLLTAMEPDAKHHQVKLVYDEGSGVPPGILGNFDRLRQVFRNIILNGMQACKAGGAVTLATTVLEEPTLLSKEQNAASPPTQRKVAVHITDTGSGIDPAIRQKIFDPFFTQKERGTGLGLSICQKIVDQHGGRIDVKSELGKGSTFTIILPAV